VTYLWGLFPKKAISQFFQVRYHLKALKVFFPMMMKHVCVLAVLVIAMSRICGTWKTGILRKYMLFFK